MFYWRTLLCVHKKSKIPRSQSPYNHTYMEIHGTCLWGCVWLLCFHDPQQLTPTLGCAITVFLFWQHNIQYCITFQAIWFGNFGRKVQISHENGYFWGNLNKFVKILRIFFFSESPFTCITEKTAEKPVLNVKLHMFMTWYSYTYL